MVLNIEDVQSDERFEEIYTILVDKYKDETSVCCAIYDAIATYKYYRNDPEQEYFNAMELSWIRRCATEYLENIDYLGIVSYSENGYSWQRDSSTISMNLIREVTPLVRGI